MVSLLLPCFKEALRRGLHTISFSTWGVRTWVSQAAQLPSSKVSHRRPRRPRRKSLRAAACVATVASMTSRPPPSRTAIVVVAECTSIPIYLKSSIGCSLAGRCCLPKKHTQTEAPFHNASHHSHWSPLSHLNLLISEG